MPLHLNGLETAAARCARPHAFRVVVQPLHHLLLVHAQSVTFFSTNKQHEGAYMVLMASHRGFSSFLCAAPISFSAFTLIITIYFI